MKIVVEGADNAGKSTLVDYLAKELKMNVYRGEGPARSEQEINDRVLKYETFADGIYDRHPCVSHPIYSSFAKNSYTLNPELISIFYGSRPLFIYCIARDTLEGHNERDVDSVENGGERHSDMIAKNHSQIVLRYHQWALRHANIVYRIGDDMDRIVDMLRERFDPVEDIALFHEKFGLEYSGPPRSLDHQLSIFRTGFINEEFNEYCAHDAKAFSAKLDHKPDLAEYAYQLEGMLDALVDLVYVALGTAYLHGFDFKEAWRRVQTANMAKVRAKHSSESKRGSTYDVVKPEGWQAPSHIDLVEENDLSIRYK